LPFIPELASLGVIANDVVYAVGAGNSELHVSKASKASLSRLAAGKRLRIVSRVSAIEVDQYDSGHTRCQGDSYDGQLAFNCMLRRYFAAFDNQRSAPGGQTRRRRTKREPPGPRWSVAWTYRALWARGQPRTRRVRKTFSNEIESNVLVAASRYRSRNG